MKGIFRMIIKSPISVVFLIMFIVFLLLRKPSDPTTRIFKTRMLPDQSSSGSRKLVELLRVASMPSRTVILAIIDKSWASHTGSILDLFLESFKIGQQTKHLLNHLVIVALDSQSLHHCKSIHTHCFHLKATKKPFKTMNYPTLAQTRNKLLQQVLQFSYNLVYTDVDVMWLRNPFPLFDGMAQITIGCDSYSSYEYGDSEKASGGFFYMKADAKSIEFFKLRNVAKVLYPNTQNKSMCEIVMHEDLRMLDFMIKFIETTYYGGFCHPNNDISKIYTMHANCCGNLENKVHDLKIVLDDLTNYKAVLANGNSLGALSYWGRAPRKCRRFREA